MKVYIRIWILIVLTLVMFVLAGIFFEIPLTDKFLTPEQSRELNKPCVLFDYFDDHDM